MKIVYAPKYQRSLHTLSHLLLERITERTLIFERNPFNSRLHTHKLHGHLKGKWSFSIDKKCRVLFEFDDSDVIFLDVGNHEIYR